ncbi:glucosidase II beta subunit-like protein-domain-containing protein [Bipolaris maydis]|nr:glucosidase II beta subunit-like protein-domain-containing protein [Bipolaris maydis]KAJ6197662.1 glucosidase II beta subunit-like protein-domain-containing protein [Bipolaris maydis]KAJ6282294.1 glucosidase II beta subunit-like protein-domain-containing protein [Bipolaris maydis]
MRGLWALPAVLRIALASQHAFSVFDDLLAFPQYEVLWPDTFITENEVTSLLAGGSPSSSSATPGSQETQELSKRDKPAADTTPTDDALEHTYEAVVLHGQRYLCSIPIIPEEVAQNDTTSAEDAKAEEEKELVRATDRGWELLEGMRDNCIYYLSGWWSYRFCYKGEVKQFHQLPPGRGVPIYPPVEDESVHSFVLGRFPTEEKNKKANTRKTLGNEQGSKEGFDDEDDEDEGDAETKGLELPRLETKGSSRYMVQRLSDGTECDLTGKPRKIDVQFHCNPQSADRISMVKETSTCSYLMIVDTPRLCHDVAFTPPQEKLAHPIICEPVIAESEVESWTAVQESTKLAAAERLIAAQKAADDANTNPLRDITTGLEGSTKRGPIIGGIEVGAKKLVGSEGKVIERSLVVGGGKESFIVVASSDGKQMTKEEMKKHDIGNLKDVESFKNTLKKKAGKKGWKLVLATTRQGRELRGIIDTEDDVGEKKKKKKKDSDKDGDEEIAGMGREKQRKKDAQQEGEEEEVHEGSEEEYKDEL